MKHTYALTLLTLSTLLAVGGCPPSTERMVEGNPRARVATSLGEFVIELFPDAAPKTVANFRAYADDGFYADTLFHRTDPNFVIQGGGYLTGLAAKATDAPIINEASNGLPNVRGAVGAARDPNDVDSATSQFYVNVVDNPALDATLDRRGYAVFGYVVEGLGVVDAIAAVQTQTIGEFDRVPTTDVVIEQITIEPGPRVLADDWASWEAGARYNLLDAGRTFLVDTLSWLIGR